MVFNELEIEQFLSDGYLILRGAFSAQVAAECREFVWKQVPLWDQCTSNGMPMVHLKKGFSCAPFDHVASDRLKSARDQIVGAGRWNDPGGYGWWPLLFPGFPGSGGWHLDGNPSVVGYPTEHHHALVTLFLFSDVGPGDGGTPMLRGSHLDVGRVVADAGRSGVTWTQVKLKLAANLLNPGESQIAHVTGEAGDVALLHPFLIHGFGANRGNRIRFACNPPTYLMEPLNLQRPDSAYSVLERSIRKMSGLRD
jgi:phytanoyl-CoA dioxygenase PhyH